MSSIFSELRRSERLLPVEDFPFFRRIFLWRPLFVDPLEHPALYEHVAFFRSDVERGAKWMHTVRSARVSTRQVPFMTLKGFASFSLRAPGAKEGRNVCSGVGSSEVDDVDDVPELSVCRQRVMVLSYYECLMCPTLLFSPIRLSFIGRIAIFAVQLSLPVHEFLIFVSLMLVYLDTVITLTSPKPLSFHELIDVLEQCCARFFGFVGNQNDHQRSSDYDGDGDDGDNGSACGNAFDRALRMAMGLWKERREATVTALFPLGILTAAVCPRDIYSTAYCTFMPCVPRDTRRENHPFRLPPLAADVLARGFVPAWERILLAARRDVSVLATLHNHILRTVVGSLRAGRAAESSNVFFSLGALPQTKEELADFLCRIGSSLWASDGTAQSVVLSKSQSQFVSDVIKREFFEVLLYLCHRGVQEFRVRRIGFSSLALTVIHDDGREVVVGCPFGLFTGRTSMGDGTLKGYCSFSANNNGVTSGGLSLRLVAEGGFDVLQAFVRHLLASGRSSTVFAAQPFYYNDDNSYDCGSAGDSDKNTNGYGGKKKSNMEKSTITTAIGTKLTEATREEATVAKEEQRFLLLTPAEEGVLHRIFQSHPHALRLAGCGVKQLLLRATDGQHFLRRTCGGVIAWDPWKCYEPLDSSTLRLPVRITTASAPFPLPDGVSSSRVTFRNVRRMVNYYWKALLDEQQRAAELQLPVMTRTTLFPVDKLIAVYVLRHHPQYYTRMRGCGVLDICVQKQPCSSDRKKFFSSIGGMRKNKEGMGKVTTTMMGGTCESVPMLVVIHPCGNFTFFDIEDCYNVPANRLHRPQLLDGSSDMAKRMRCDSSSTRKRCFLMAGE